MNVELQLRVQDLVARYAAALDAGRYEAWPGVLHGRRAIQDHLGGELRARPAAWRIPL